MKPADTYAAMAHLDARNGPTADERIAQLVEATDALAAALQTLRTNPTRDGAESIATQIYGMHRQAVMTVEALAREQGKPSV
jgi:hypothetical protein